jgi:hypothetical protein
MNHMKRNNHENREKCYLTCAPRPVLCKAIMKSMRFVYLKPGSRWTIYMLQAIS